MEPVTLTLWFSKCGSKLAAAAEYLETCQQFRFLGPIPDFLDQNLGGGGVVICLNGPLDSDVHLSLRTAALEQH